MPLDSHDRKDDDVRRLSLPASRLDTAHQSSSFWKFNNTSHASPPPTAARAHSPKPKAAGSARVPIKPRPWLTVR